MHISFVVAAERVCKPFYDTLILRLIRAFASSPRRRQHDRLEPVFPHRPGRRVDHRRQLLVKRFRARAIDSILLVVLVALRAQVQILFDERTVDMWRAGSNPRRNLAVILRPDRTAVGGEHTADRRGFGRFVAGYVLRVDLLEFDTERLGGVEQSLLGRVVRDRPLDFVLRIGRPAAIV